MKTVARRTATTLLKRTNLFPLLKGLQEAHQPSRRRKTRHRTEFYSQFIDAGQLCFDIGANMGNRTDVFLRLGAGVVAVEPQPICIPVLRHRFGNNSSFTLIEAGLGRSSGTTTMFLSEAHTLSSFSAEYVQSTALKPWRDQCLVRLTTLDALISVFGVPGFVKIDVEGYESSVIEGLSEPLPLLSLEFNPQVRDVAAAALSRLASLDKDYRFAFSRGESFILDSWKSLDGALRIIADMPSSGDFYCASPIPPSLGLG